MVVDTYSSYTARFKDFFLSFSHHQVTGRQSRMAAGGSKMVLIDVVACLLLLDKKNETRIFFIDYSLVVNLLDVQRKIKRQDTS